MTKRVLVVEDEPAIGLDIVWHLEEIGDFEVVSTGSGAAALSLAAGDGFDCIVLDLGLPDVNGIEVLRHLRRKELRTAVVVMTGFQDEKIRAHVEHVGVNAYFEKPADMGLLIMSIKLLACYVYDGVPLPEAVFRRPRSVWTQPFVHSGILCPIT